LKKRLTEALRARYGEDPEAAGGGAWLARYHAEEPLLHGWQALCFIELGRRDEARAALEAALDIDGKCVPALEAEKRLTE
jgi:tetratricopeptide (TPR) repeat protein